MTPEEEILYRHGYGKNRFIYYNDKLKIAKIELPYYYIRQVREYIGFLDYEEVEVDKETIKITARYNNINDILNWLNAIEFILGGDKEFGLDLLHQTFYRKDKG